MAGLLAPVNHLEDDKSSLREGEFQSFGKIVSDHGLAETSVISFSNIGAGVAVTLLYVSHLKYFFSRHTILFTSMDVCIFIFGVSLWKNILWRSLQPASNKVCEDLFSAGTKKSKRFMRSCK